MTSTTGAVPEEGIATELELLKTDLLGRVRTPTAKREAILDAFERSGLSGQAFAEHLGVKYPTFATWLQKRKKARGEYPQSGGKQVKAPLALVEAIVEHEVLRAELPPTKIAEFSS